MSEYSSVNPLVNPLRYDAAFENIEEDEAQTTAALIESLSGRQRVHATRARRQDRRRVKRTPTGLVAKVAVAPLSPALKALTDAPLNVNGKPNGLREAVMDFFAQHDAEWEVRIQLCTDPDKMPIDDAFALWPEDLSPYVAVARIRASAQQAWSEARSSAIDDGMALSPWHGVAAHRPLGSIMRVRKIVYETMAKQRERYNRQSLAEPQNLDDLPDKVAYGEAYMSPTVEKPLQPRPGL